MLFKVLFIGHKQQHCGDLKRVRTLRVFSFQQCIQNLYDWPREKWQQTLVWKSYHQESFPQQILHFESCGNREIKVWYDCLILNSMMIQDNDHARVAAIKVFKGSLFPRNSGRCHDGSIYAFLLILGWLQHSQGNHHYQTQSQSLVSVSRKMKFAKFRYPVFLNKT